MEYTLAGIWKGQMANARTLRAMPGKFTEEYICTLAEGRHAWILCGCMMWSTG